MPKPPKYTDEELKEALIRTGGQPTKAAELLGVEYVGVYLRIRKNPELYEIQKAHRSKTFNDLTNITSVIAMAGIIKEPITDEDGTVIKGQFREVSVDYKTRLSAIQTLMNTFKADEGIKEEISITQTGSIDVASWLKANNTISKNDTDTGGI